MMISECCTKEKPLLRRAQSGDPDAIELFLAGYVPLLRALAKRFFCVSLSVQDLCQAGYIGLMLALEHYNAEQGAEFITYAMPWALGEMKKALRQADDFTGAQRFGRQVSRELRRLSASLGREPRIEELAQACHTSPSDVVCALKRGIRPCHSTNRLRTRGERCSTLWPGEIPSTTRSWIFALRLCAFRFSSEI